MIVTDGVGRTDIVVEKPKRSTDDSQSVAAGSIAGPLDSGHCDPDCMHLAPHGKEFDLTARCNLVDDELGWYDYWMAVCKEQ